MDAVSSASRKSRCWLQTRSASRQRHAVCSEMAPAARLSAVRAAQRRRHRCAIADTAAARRARRNCVCERERERERERLSSSSLLSLSLPLSLWWRDTHAHTRARTRTNVRRGAFDASNTRARFVRVSKRESCPAQRARLCLSTLPRVSKTEGFASIKKNSGAAGALLAGDGAQSAHRHLLSQLTVSICISFSVSRFVFPVRYSRTLESANALERGGVSF